MIETIISVMLFLFMVAGVTMIVTSATNSIRSTQFQAEDVQATINALVSRDTSVLPTPPTPQTQTVTATLSDSTATLSDVEATHSGTLTSAEDLVYFYTTP